MPLERACIETTGIKNTGITSAI